MDEDHFDLVTLTSDIRTSDFPHGEVVAHLVVLTGESPGKTHVIGKTTTIGRSPQSSIRVGDSHVSRHHAKIRRLSNGAFSLEDLGSHNGTYINGTRVTGACMLEFGDRIQLGPQLVMMFTYRDLLEQQLLQSQKLESIGRLAGGIAHDFNNLLNIVLGNISYLEQARADTTLADEEVRECLSEVSEVVKRAASLTDQLLGFARQGDFDKRALSMSGLVAEVEKLVRRTFSGTIDIESEIEPDLFVLGDLAQLQQVVLNLCLNARDAMAEGGKLTLRVFERKFAKSALPPQAHLRPGRFVVCTVKDSGTGMDKDTAERIFEPFFSTKPKGRGTGLGLATAYGIVRRHGGYIDVKSQPGRGSVFSVRLPRTDAVEEPAKKDTPSQELGRKSVLIVDDERLIRTVTQRFLSKLGLEVHTAPEGREAIELYKEKKDNIDIVLLDLMMPGMTGLETLEELKKLDKDVRVLLMSGHVDPELERSVPSSGAHGFLRKPFDTTELREALSRALEAKQES